VKQIMEEAVTRKFVHEDSSHIISFCAAVEACVLHGLRRRAAGFLRSNKIAALFMKVGKNFPPAEDLSRKVQDLEQLIESARNQIQGLQENVRKLPKLPNLSPLAIKHLWIRTALFEKVLDKIVHYLVENSSKYYEKEALLMDPVDGPILASLLVGPCALEYTKMKTADHFWTDPSADELVQRHRIHSSHVRQDSPTKRPALCIQKRHSSGSMDDRPSLSARDYVESLHQNSRATLLYGKNNVLVQPRDDMEAVPGYLSLHQTADVMTLKWTPNQLMNGSVGDLDYEKSVYWDYAMTIRLEEIVYLHCHQQVDSGGTVVLVSQDGIQRPPFRFPKGGHLLQFLSCLENGLLPHGQLDPPLWSQRGKGKVFPKLRKRSPQGSAESTSSDKDDDEATDYVFRIIYPGMQSEFSYEEQELLRLIYYGGIQPEIRKAVWPFLLGHYQFGMTETERKESSQSCSSGRQNIRLHSDSSSSTQVFESVDEVEQVEAEGRLEEKQPKIPNGNLVNGTCSPDSGHPSSHNFSSGLSEHSEPSLSTEDSVLDAQRNTPPVLRPRDGSVDDRQSSEATTSQDEAPREELAVQDSLESDLLANESMDEFMSITGSLDVALPEKDDVVMEGWRSSETEKHGQADSEDNLSEEPEMESLFPALASLAVTTSANEVSPVSSSGVTYSPELLDLYTVNLHRIEKDVQRCDRNYWYFTPANLEKLRNIMCSYIWQHIEIGYVQGMCDLLAPLLVILDDEALAFSCFTELMKRMNQNFPHGGAMDTHFANMRSLIQILDSELFELMHQNGDYTHFYFCYRWFLLDFKRELVYDDVFLVWETIWAAKHVSSAHYVLFIALALVEVYRDIILENNMDFTDIIKFFNEMAERHNTKQVLKLARDLVYKVQTLIENK
uniref:Small G protein signaling modulator 1 n=1 Tax=Gorilla gorilla gorilla TaxID=9595 RepID=G3RNJ0_GORGO